MNVPANGHRADDGRFQASATAQPHACPGWCVEPHHDTRERRHLAELRDVPVTTDAIGKHVPTLFLDLRQAPDDDRPLIHLNLDDGPVARLQPSEAIHLAKQLITLVELSR